MAASSAKDKAHALKDSYVDTLVKGGVTEPAQRMPETDLGKVALEPVSTMIGLGVAAGAVLHHLPELNKAVGNYGYLPRGSFENDKKNRVKSNIRTLTGFGDYDNTDFNKQHFDKTGEIKPYTAEQKSCISKHQGGYPDAYCDYR
jgi:hypothetical protein